MSYYFSRLRPADSADVSGKLAFWTPLMKQSQTHQRCIALSTAPTTDSSTTTATTHRSITATAASTASTAWLSFTLSDMQHRFTRVSRASSTSLVHTADCSTTHQPAC